MDFQRILIAVDDGPIAARAAVVGMSLARALHARVALVHAVEPSPVFAPGAAGDELAREAGREARRLLAELRARLTGGGQALEFVRQGPAGSVVVTAAGEWDADLIVIGSHGRRGLPRALLGSVAEAVMREAPCPVLVVRDSGE
jgi:nucleotide-binding universal stress UspA family protein